MKKSILIILKVAFSAFCIFHLIRNFGHEFNSVKFSSQQIDYTYLLLGLFFFFISQLVSVWRWKSCCDSLNISANLNSPFPTINRIYLLGLFWNNFLPGSFGGDLVRAYLLKKENRDLNWPLCAGSVFIDRAFGLLALFWVGFATSLMIAPGHGEITQKLVWFTGALSLASLVIIVVFNLLGPTVAAPSDLEPELEEQKGFWEKCKLKFTEFIQALMLVEKDKLVLVKMLLASVAIQVLVTLCLISLAKGLDLTIEPALLWLVNPVVTLGSLVAPSINGLGVREGIYAYLFKSLGYPGSDGIMLSVAWLFVLLVMSLPGAFLLFIQKQGHKASEDLKESVSLAEQRP